MGTDNFYVLEELRKWHQEELHKRMQFNETYQLYSDVPRKKVCADFLLRFAYKTKAQPKNRLSSVFTSYGYPRKQPLHLSYMQLTLHRTYQCFS
jgi:hypothetical protein